MKHLNTKVKCVHILHRKVMLKNNISHKVPSSIYSSDVGFLGKGPNTSVSRIGPGPRNNVSYIGMRYLTSDVFNTSNWCR